MPLFGNAFFAACKGYSDTVAMAYLRAVWHYYNHLHCAGMPDRDDYLRKVCELTPDEWEQARPVIFDNQLFFTKNGDNLWHQKRAKETWEEEKSIAQSRQNQTAAARAARWPQSVTGSVTESGLTPAQIVLYDKELERVVARMKAIRDGYLSHQTWDEQHRQQFAELRARRDELKAKLRIKYT